MPKIIRLRVEVSEIILLFVGAMVFLLMGISSYNHIDQMRREGVLVSGEITNAYSRDRFTTIYIVSFTTKGSEKVTTELGSNLSVKDRSYSLTYCGGGDILSSS